MIQRTFLPATSFTASAAFTSCKTPNTADAPQTQITHQQIEMFTHITSTAWSHTGC